MNKALFALIGYSSSLGTIFGTATVASPDYTKIIPFPEVVDLKRVPTFNAKGIVPQVTIARKNTPRQSQIQQSRDWRNKTPAKVAIIQGKGFTKELLNCDFSGCRNPTHQMMGVAINF
jgi:hypothetical protein